MNDIHGYANESVGFVSFMWHFRSGCMRTIFVFELICISHRDDQFWLQRLDN